MVKNYIIPGCTIFIIMDKVQVNVEYSNDFDERDKQLYMIYRTLDHALLFTQTHKLESTDFTEGSMIDINRVNELAQFYFDRVRYDNFPLAMMREYFINGHINIPSYLVTSVKGINYIDMNGTSMISIKSDGVYFYSIDRNEDNSLREFYKDQYFNDMQDYFTELTDTEGEKRYGVVVRDTLHIDKKSFGDRSIEFDYHPILRLDVEYFRKIIKEVI